MAEMGFSTLGARSPRSGCMPAWSGSGEGCRPGCFLVRILTWQKELASCLDYSQKATTIHENSTLLTELPPTGPTSNTTALGWRLQHMNLGRTPPLSPQCMGRRICLSRYSLKVMSLQTHHNHSDETHAPTGPRPSTSALLLCEGRGRTETKAVYDRTHLVELLCWNTFWLECVATGHFPLLIL